MFNLLPEIIKKEIKIDYRIRWLFVILLAVLFLQISFLIFLSPSWVNSFFREKELVSQLNEINKSSSYQDANTTSSIIESTNVKLKIINTDMEYPKVVPLIGSILSNKIPGISINELSYKFSKATVATITVSGVSKSRELLIAYVNSLEKSGVFSVVDLPISNLAKDMDIDFSMNLTVSQ